MCVCVCLLSHIAEIQADKASETFGRTRFRLWLPRPHGSWLRDPEFWLPLRTKKGKERVKSGDGVGSGGGGVLGQITALSHSMRLLSLSATDRKNPAAFSGF